MSFKDEYGIELPSLETIDEQENPLIIAKFYNAIGNGEWYVIGGEELDNGDYYLFGYAKDLIEDELGFFTLQQIKSIGLIVQDKTWKPIGLYSAFEELNYIKEMMERI